MENQAAAVCVDTYLIAAQHGYSNQNRVLQADVHVGRGHDARTDSRGAVRFRWGRQSPRRAGRPRVAPLLRLKVDSERLLPAALGILNLHGCLHVGPIPKPVLRCVSPGAYSELLLGSRFFSPWTQGTPCPRESGHETQRGTERIEPGCVGAAALPLPNL